MKVTVFLAPALLAATMLAGCSKDEPTPVTASTASTIKVAVAEAGAPPYDLAEARVVNSNYQTAASSLTITGKLSSGKVLNLEFSRGAGSPPANTTNVLTASLDGTTGTASSGTTTYNAQTRTVSGSFKATFVGPGEVSGSFSGIAVQ
ncbi:hypothetical protein GCM10028824_33380 [Hymenobacter segetis]|uniref:Lipoprotein n=1 Tax=Hymenobacter segetis TaxID=2025509 RepID=A0ABU9M0Y9_9BACT